MNKTTKSNLITYGMVIILFAVMQILVMGGHISSLLQGLLVPLCAYIILAVSLNLTVGILGELSLGHAGFMCVGAFTSAFFFQMYGRGDSGSRCTVSSGDFNRRSIRRYLRNFDWYSGASAKRRLSGDCNACVWGDY